MPPIEEALTLTPTEPLPLYVSHDKDFHWLVALEYGRVGENQPQDCWVALSATCAYLLDAPGGRVLGFRVNEFDTFDPDDPEVAAIWEDPRFDAPVLGLTNVTAGEIILAARQRFAGRDSLNRVLFAVACGSDGEDAIERWRQCLESGDAMAHHGLGYTLLVEGHHAEAYRHLRHYTEIAPEGAWNWCWYGQAAEAIGETSEARRAYRRAIELEADDEDEQTDAAERLAALEDVARARLSTLGQTPPTRTPTEAPADSPTVSASIFFDGEDRPELGRRGLEALDDNLAAGITAGSHRKGYGHTDPNEDAIRIQRDGEVTVLVCADGHNGESSARHAAQFVASSLDADTERIDDEAGLVQLLHVTNDLVREATGIDEQPESRTTLVLAVLVGGRVRWASMGDSLIAMVEPDGSVRRLGEPRHRFLGWPMDPDDVAAAVDHGYAELRPGGWLVLASDGLPDFAVDWRETLLEATGVGRVAARPPEDPTGAIVAPSALQAVDALIDAACAGGAGDNVSVIAMRRSPEDTSGGGRPRHASTREVPGSAEVAPSVRERILGGFLAGAVGDALGAGIEFDSLERIRQRYGPEGVTDPVAAYGQPAAITDDTQMTLFTAEGLLRAETRFADRGICDRVGVIDLAYLRWLGTQSVRSARGLPSGDARPGWLVGVPGLHAQRAPGRTCIAAMRGARAGRLGAPTNDSKGCGGVMRVAPVGLMGARYDSFRLGCDAAIITHGHPTGYLAAGALTLLVARLREGDELEEALDRVETELADHVRHEETLHAIRGARRLAEASAPSPEAVELLGEGWVADEALAMAVYCALKARDLEHGLLLAVNHGGDSDSTGAICGSILGTMWGARAIPPRWLEDLELRDVIEQVSTDFDAVFGEEPGVDVESTEWLERYPPV